MIVEKTLFLEIEIEIIPEISKDSFKRSPMFQYHFFLDDFLIDSEIKIDGKAMEIWIELMFFKVTLEFFLLVEKLRVGLREIGNISWMKYFPGP